MTIGRSIGLGAALAAALTSGCATHESLGRPPSPADLALVNAAAAGRTLRVEPIVPIVQVGSCAAGGCTAADTVRASQAVGVVDPVRVLASDGEHVTFGDAGGLPRTVPLAPVAGVSTLDRGRGALIGGVAGGLGMGAIGLALGTWLASLPPWDPGSPPPPNQCKDCEAAALAGLLAVEGVLLGAGIGWAVGSRRYFDFDGHTPKASPNTGTNTGD
jgi:hypothetical protein